MAPHGTLAPSPLSRTGTVDVPGATGYIDTEDMIVVIIRSGNQIGRPFEHGIGKHLHIVQSDRADKTDIRAGQRFNLIRFCRPAFT